MKILHSCLLILFIFSGPNAYANKQLPNQVDLLAAYCIAVINKQLRNWADGDLKTQEEIEIQQAFLEMMRQEKIPHLNRLKRYLEPRAPHLEIGGLLVAAKSGVDDVELGYKEIAQCQKTNTTCLKEGAYSNSCATQCISSPVIQRLQRCDLSNFLPH